MTTNFSTVKLGIDLDILSLMPLRVLTSKPHFEMLQKAHRKNKIYVYITSYFKVPTDGHTLRREANPMLISCFISVPLKLSILQMENYIQSQLYKYYVSNTS